MSNDAALDRPRIALADDDVDSAAMLAMVLEMEGYDVHLLRPGDRAEAVLAQSRLMAVLTDLGMPWRSGYELAREFLAIDPGLPVLAVTGQSRDALNLSPQRGLFREIFEKPIDIDALLAYLTGLRQPDRDASTRLANRP